ncbi:hypothetical protein [Aliiglaciecola sp. LCG003]|uniref:hypothetical protein n=1 Tax=Aliiglaciecola sp. LCG003 TaxID=3053655 RepID=UPI00257461B0|nr:hypothetical protein [Aliiglaciecola sp. LCG003]WJG10470.1 hypothetical protein QR722_05365 [Aliiglaciecola sp. LCG003]
MISGHFFPSGDKKLFVSQFGQHRSDNTILLLPSVFEEMNLCRAIIAKQAQFLVQHGYCVYVLDYAGCGDSEGNIEQVDAGIWQQNIIDCVSWLKLQGTSSITLWGVRFGALLMFQQLEQINQILTIDKLLLWKPVSKGKQFMTQFLRLKQASSMIQGETKTNWRDSILAGNNTEVGGYEITSTLLESIDGLEIPKKLSVNFPIHWLELASNSISPAVTIQTKHWGQSNLKLGCLEGSAFWQIPEIFVQAHLHQPTLDALEDNA